MSLSTLESLNDMQLDVFSASDHAFQDAPSMQIAFEKSQTKQNTCDKGRFSVGNHAGPCHSPEGLCLPLAGLKNNLELGGQEDGDKGRRGKAEGSRPPRSEL